MPRSNRSSHCSFPFSGQLSRRWMYQIVPSMLWRCWLGIRKSIWPAKNWVMRCWCGYLSGARCRLFAYGPADATASKKTPSSLASLKSRLVLPFWYQLTEVVLEKRPLNGCSSSSSSMDTPDSVTHGKCNTRSTVTFPAKQHRFSFLFLV